MKVVPDIEWRVEDNGSVWAEIDDECDDLRILSLLK